jgi:hypothetical protein
MAWMRWLFHIPLCPTTTTFCFRPTKSALASASICSRSMAPALNSQSKFARGLLSAKQASQFGQGFARVRDFRRRFLHTLHQVQTAYPDARLEADDKGLTLHHSRPPVARGIPS